MGAITIKKSNLPFLFKGGGDLKVDLGALPAIEPIPRDGTPLLAVKFGASGDQDFLFGSQASFKLKIGVGASFSLKPIWGAQSAEEKALLERFGLTRFAEQHPGRVLLYLDTGARADLNLKGRFQYSLLSAGVAIEAGADARFEYLRAGDETLTAKKLLGDYFLNLRLPSAINAPLEAGEVIAYEYSGRLKLGGEVSLGYTVSGAPSFEIGQLKLSERYQVAVAASLRASASIAGRFRIEARAAQDELGEEHADWVRVTVRKSRTRGFNLAADVRVAASARPQGLPGSADEFLGAALGVNAKNWLNLIEDVRETCTDFDKLEKNLDDLAKDFLGEWVGKAFAELEESDALNALLAKARKASESYRQVEDYAVSLFDRYFDKLGFLEQQLAQLRSWTSWDRLRGSLDDEVWRIIEELTNGDPLGWALGKIPGPGGEPVPSLAELHARAGKTLDLIRSEAHREIREAIALAKSRFGLDRFFEQLAEVDSIPELKAIANKRLGAFVERLIGQGVSAMKNSELGAAVTRIHRVLGEAEDFQERFYDKLREAFDQKFSLRLTAAYNRSSEQDSLVEALLDLSTEEGRRLMVRAGQGDFEAILSAGRSPAVRILGGKLSDRDSRATSFSINIIGWHSGWRYQGFDKVIVESEQQIRAGETGALTVYSTVDLRKEKERVRNDERMHTNFLLRFVGQSADPDFDEKTRRYLIDVITGISARYELTLTDAETTAEELKSYLGFARDFGLAEAGATFEDLKDILPEKSPGNYGPITAEYEVRYGEEALKELLKASFDPAAARGVMRKIVLANYLGRGRNIAEIGWGYSSRQAYESWRRLANNFFMGANQRGFAVDPSPIDGLAAPRAVSLNRPQLQVLHTLFSIERSLVGGLERLYELIGSGRRVKLPKLQSALKEVGRALQRFDDFDMGLNTVFAVFDQLIALSRPAAEARASSLKLVSEVEEVDPEDPSNPLTRKAVKRFFSGAPT